MRSPTIMREKLSIYIFADPGLIPILSKS